MHPIQVFILLDNVTAAYAQFAGILLSSSGGGAGGGPVVNSEEFIKFQAAQHKFAKQQVELYMQYLNLNTHAGHHAADAEKGNVTALQAKLDAINREHGDFYIDGIQPVFEPLKARHFDSWNWV
jgi:fatty acid synthase subunit alpha